MSLLGPNSPSPIFLLTTVLTVLPRAMPVLASLPRTALATAPFTLVPIALLPTHLVTHEVKPLLRIPPTVLAIAVALEDMEPVIVARTRPTRAVDSRLVLATQFPFLMKLPTRRLAMHPLLIRVRRTTPRTLVRSPFTALLEVTTALKTPPILLVASRPPAVLLTSPRMLVPARHFRVPTSPNILLSAS